ncbi:MAG: FAD-dependent oxidoreductase [Magnetovibrio sp.]|nr:FAD-dependent oxidoreductase [Magnetovibrio sp.]
MVEHVDCIVIGAGCIGLAVARSLAQAEREVVLLENSETIGTGISSRNSEEIHAGIYYPSNSLKARLCVRGRNMLYDYCESHGIAYKRIGKLIVATEKHEVPILESIGLKARANGVDNLEWIDGFRLQELEPNIRAVAAWLSPSTGIIDSHGYMLSLQGDIENAGGVIAFHSPVLEGQVSNNKLKIKVGGENPMELSSNILVNAAGLGAQNIARRIKDIPVETIPPLYFARGNYFTLIGKCPFNHLIYPVPVAGGLGTHSTIDLGGQVKFGPDVEWLKKIDYTVEASRSIKFYADIRRYWPDLPDEALQPGYAGIRPKLSGPQDEKHGNDFIIHGSKNHGIKGLVNLFGIESPGLTSSLAIAEEVRDILDLQ